jgi:hypothetical protein
LNIRISAIREIEDPRAATAKSYPHRQNLDDPLDFKAECPLGRMRLRSQISEAEYEAGCRWRNIYHSWLCSIGAPNPFPAAIDWTGSFSEGQAPLSSGDNALADERDEAIAKAFKIGEAVLKKLGCRVFHAVNAVAVYEETEDLGDFEFTARAAKIGLKALAEIF